MLCSKKNDFTIKIQCQTSKQILTSKKNSGGIRDLGQGGGYQHPVAMYVLISPYRRTNQTSKG
jgi:hypothetical protein